MFMMRYTLTYCVQLLTYQGKVVLVCTLCSLDVSGCVGVMMKIGFPVVFYFIGGKPRSPWHDPEKHKNASKQAECKDYLNQLNGLNRKLKYKLKRKRTVSHSSLITCPPAAQAATSPYCPPSFCSRCATVVTSLQPVAPKGWPRDREPPHRLNFSMGGDPTFTHSKFFLQKHFFVEKKITIQHLERWGL